EATQAAALIEGLTLISLIADKGFDTDDIRTKLADAEVDVVIPPKASRTAEIAYDENAYGLRYLIEFHQQNQALPQGRDALPKDGTEFSGDDHGWRRYGLASRLGLNVNRT